MKGHYHSSYRFFTLCKYCKAYFSLLLSKIYSALRNVGDNTQALIGHKRKKIVSATQTQTLLAKNKFPKQTDALPPQLVQNNRVKNFEHLIVTLPEKKRKLFLLRKLYCLKLAKLKNSKSVDTYPQ